jgi:hypothetical protein
MFLQLNLYRPILKKVNATVNLHLRGRQYCFEKLTHLKILRGRHYSFQNLTQFSQENNMQDRPASNIHGFLPRDTCVSTFQLYRPVLNKVNVSVT